MSGTDDDRDLLAAEYVLGVLDGQEREAVLRRADTDDALNGALLAWETRLAPLAAIVPPVAPPAGLWARVEATCGLMASSLRPAMAAPAPVERPAGFWNALRFWRGTTALGFGLAAAVAVVAVVTRVVPPATVPTAAPLIPLASAILSPPQGPPAFVAEAASNNSLVLRPLERLSLATGKDYELWALPDGAKVPLPLGVLNKAGQTITIPASVHAPMALLVSLEQKGGSPTGLPQGPVLWQGHISELD
jgi:anti-sigma-K factor RskA